MGVALIAWGAGFCRVKAGEVVFEADKYALAGR